MGVRVRDLLRPRPCRGGCLIVEEQVLHQRFERMPVVVNFCMRDQGILLKPGNPLKIRTVKDLGKPGIRIVNRSLATGTRLLFDRELKQAGMDWMEIMPLMPENKRERLVAELQADSTYATQEARAKEFIERGGGCRRTYFNHARRLKTKGITNGSNGDRQLAAVARP